MIEEAAARIRDQLRALEQEHAITVLYACESGSRCWGFPSSDSDWDVRFIYKHARELYVSLEEPRQQIEWMGESNWGKLDIVGWDVKKALGLLRKSNPAMLEWVQSPITYVTREPFWSQLSSLTIRSFYPVASAYHYGNLARTVVPKALARDEVVFKRYFYLLRPLLALRWIADGHGVPPVEFSALIDAYVPPDSSIRREIEGLLARKRAGEELSSGPRIPVLHEYLLDAVSEMNGLLERVKSIGYRDTRPKMDELNATFRAAIEA